MFAQDSEIIITKIEGKYIAYLKCNFPDDSSREKFKILTEAQPNCEIHVFLSNEHKSLVKLVSSSTSCLIHIKENSEAKRGFGIQECKIIMKHLLVILITLIGLSSRAQILVSDGGQVDTCAGLFLR